MRTLNNPSPPSSVVPSLGETNANALPDPTAVDATTTPDSATILRASINTQPSPRPRCPMPPRPAVVDAPDATPLHLREHHLLALVPSPPPASPLTEHPNAPGGAFKKDTTHVVPPPPNPMGFWVFTRAWGRGGGEDLDGACKKESGDRGRRHRRDEHAIQSFLRSEATSANSCQRTGADGRDRKPPSAAGERMQRGGDPPASHRPRGQEAVHPPPASAARRGRRRHAYRGRRPMSRFLREDRCDAIRCRTAHAVAQACRRPIPPPPGAATLPGSHTPWIWAPAHGAAKPPPPGVDAPSGGAASHGSGRPRRPRIRERKERPSAAAIARTDFVRRRPPAAAEGEEGRWGRSWRRWLKPPVSPARGATRDERKERRGGRRDAQ